VCVCVCVCVCVLMVGPDTCYSVAFMSQTRDLQRFTISDKAAGWYELMDGVTVQPSIVALTDKWTRGAASRHTTTLISRTRPSPPKTEPEHEIAQECLPRKGSSH